MSGTVYLKIEKNVQIRSRSGSLKDIAQIVLDDSALGKPDAGAEASGGYGSGTRALSGSL